MAGVIKKRLTSETGRLLPCIEFGKARVNYDSISTRDSDFEGVTVLGIRPGDFVFATAGLEIGNGLFISAAGGAEPNVMSLRAYNLSGGSVNSAECDISYLVVNRDAAAR